jgi:hypothetical protein
MITLTGNGNTDIKVTSARRHTVSVSGTFDSGTVALQWGQGGSWFAYTDADGIITFTAAGAIEIVTPTADLRLALSGVVSAATITVAILPIKG